MEIQDITKSILNPIRMRIIQHLILNQTATASEIREQLSDVPQASLYRHIKKLVDCGILIVASENRIRGAVEKVYSLSKSLPLQDPEADQNKVAMRQIYNILMLILGDFERYFHQNSNADPTKDLLFCTTSTLLLSDEEFMKFTAELGEVFNKILANEPTPERRMRRFTTISSPVIDS